MKRISTKPYKRLTRLLWLPFVIALGQSLLLLPQQSQSIQSAYALVGQAWLFLTLIIVVAVIYDYIQARIQPSLSFERQCKDIVSLHRWAQVSLKVSHQFQQPTHIELKELIPDSLELNESSLNCQLLPDKTTSLNYSTRPNQRGDAWIKGIEIRHYSPFGLWQSVWQAQHSSLLKVYPDFQAISGYALMATDNHVSQLGIKKVQRRGEGMEFHQLREYQRGDSSRQIDWKATARRQKLISREYQDERDQQIIILLDNGRRMRSEDNQLGHLDHSVNAMSLLSHIALKQGDAVGLMSFGRDQRWLPCKKGSAHINNILNHVYDLQPGLHATDYSSAAQKLLTMQRKRSLVILITNTRDEDIDDLLPAIKLISKNHLVLLANIREPELQQTLDTPVNDLNSAYRYCGTIDYLQRRQQVKQHLTEEGVFLVDAQPQDLPIQVCNSYLDIKRSGYL